MACILWKKETWTAKRNVLLSVFATLILGSACRTDSPTSSLPVGAVGLAKGGGGGNDTPTVTSTAPSSTVQDTTLDVSVYGTGFTAGAAATWSLTGDTSLVQVTSTTLINSGELIARIVVPATAPVARYDVVVTLTNGKKGVGAEKFEVLSNPSVKDPSATWRIPLNDAGLSLRSDRLLGDGTYSNYASGVCGVTGRIFATYESGPTPSGDAIVSMPYPKGRSCGRRVTMVYPDGSQETLATFSNLNKLQNVDLTNVIPVGQSEYRRLIVGFGATMLNNPTSGRCERVIFGDNGVVGAGTDMLLVTRLSPTTWRVQSQPAPNNRAFCEKLGVIYGNMIVDFVIEASYPLPG